MPIAKMHLVIGRGGGGYGGGGGGRSYGGGITLHPASTQAFPP